MERYFAVIVGAALMLAATWAIYARNKQEKSAPKAATRQRDKLPKVWSAFKRVDQLRVGSYILACGDAFLVETFVRHGLSSLAPAFRCRLSNDDAVYWLHVQTGPGGRMDAWFLMVAPWLDEVPQYDTVELTYGLKGVFNDAIWGELTCYANDEVVSSGVLRYGRFFWSPAQSIVTAPPPAGAPRDMVSFEWDSDATTPVVLYGIGLDPDRVRVS